MWPTWTCSGLGSLFERLSVVARTAMGEETLAAWLKGPAAVETGRRRQEAVSRFRGAARSRRGHGGPRHGHPGRGEPDAARVVGGGPARRSAGIRFARRRARAGGARRGRLSPRRRSRVDGTGANGRCPWARRRWRWAFVIRSKLIVDPAPANVDAEAGELRLLALRSGASSASRSRDAAPGRRCARRRTTPMAAGAASLRRAASRLGARWVGLPRRVATKWSASWRRRRSGDEPGLAVEALAAR